MGDSEIVKSISDELGADITENLTFLNYVSIQRKKDFLNSFENIGYILLTGNTLTIKVAFHEKVKPDGFVPLATSLSWITNKFWFKLNKGFGDGNFPASFDVVAKAQMVLSSILNKSIGGKYDELQLKLKNGEITEEIAKARVIELRSQARKPEDISHDDVSPILDVLSEDSLEKFAREQEFAKNEAIKQSQENLELKKELSLKEKALAEKEDAQVKAQRELIHVREKVLSDKKEIIEKLEKSKTTIDKLAIRDFRNFKITFGVATTVLFAIPCFITWKSGFDFMSLLSFLIPLLLLAYLLVFEKEWNWKPSLFLKKKKEQYFQKKYIEFNFDINHLNKLKDEIKMLEDD